MNKQTSRKSTYKTFCCSGCGICCTIPIVPVTDSDIKRLIKSTGLNTFNLVRFYSPSEIEFDKFAEIWIKFNYGKRIMGLRKKLNKCIFLNDNNRCTYYSSRPMTCRSFPYVIDIDNCNNKIVSINDIVNCQSSNAAASDLQQVIATSQKENREDKIFFKKIKDWNNSMQSGGTNEFLTWCGL